MKVLVTGHDGDIGTVLTPVLLAAGHQVVGLDTGLFADCVLGEVPAVEETRAAVRDVGRHGITWRSSGRGEMPQLPYLWVLSGSDGTQSLLDNAERSGPLPPWRASHRLAESGQHHPGHIRPSSEPDLPGAETRSCPSKRRHFATRRKVGRSSTSQIPRPPSDSNRRSEDPCWEVEVDHYRRGDLVFDVIDAGPADGPAVILLHGFPQTNICWDAVIPKLTAQGYRCLAPNQRGYSHGARPARRRDYRASELVEDVRALIDAGGAQRVHLVGHDFGALVTWFAAAEIPDRLASASALSTPHPIGGLKALVTSRQALASWYVYVFQLPAIPERVFVGRRGTGDGLSKFLRTHGQTPARAERDARAMAAPGAFTAAVNWYRAMPLNRFLHLMRTTITVPTMHVFSDGDTFLSPEGAYASGRGVSGEYRFEVLRGVSHWIPDEDPDAVAGLLLEWFAAHPI